MNERQTPSDLDAERAVLGSLLLERDAIIAVAPWLQPADFYLETHRWIYEAALRCYQRRVPPDVVTVASDLREHNRLVDVGDLAGLMALSDGVPTAYHVEHYGRTVAHAALCRRVIAAGATIAALGYQDDQDDQDAQTLVAEAMAALTSAVQHRQDDAVCSLENAVTELLDVMSRGAAPGISTGLVGLDQKLGGMHPGDLLILAARTSVGKTSLSLQLAYTVAKAGGRVFLASMEMDQFSITQRLLALLTGYDLGRIRRHELGDGELPRLMEAAGRLQQLPMVIDPSGTLTVPSLRARTLRHMAEHGPLALVVVDYLQLMSAPGHKGNRVTEVGEISRGLKQLAVELRCPVLALSQLNRGPENRPNKVPNLADLRESGSIENDADVVLFIYREEMHDRDSDKKGIAELHIAKHRQGAIGMTPLFFQPASGRWRDVTLYATGVTA